jgi:hypothetical protein
VKAPNRRVTLDILVFDELDPERRSGTGRRVNSACAPSAFETFMAASPENNRGAPSTSRPSTSR